MTTGDGIRFTLPSAGLPIFAAPVPFLQIAGYFHFTLPQHRPDYTAPSLLIKAGYNRDVTI